MATPVPNARGRSPGTALLLALAFLFAVLAAVTVSASARAHGGLDAEPRPAREAIAGDLEVSLMRTPIIMRGCISDSADGRCAYRVAAPAAGADLVTAGITPSFHRERFAMIGLLALALAMALTLAAVFWRHLAASIADDPFAPAPRPHRRR